MQFPFGSAGRKKSRLGVSASAEGLALVLLEQTGSRVRLVQCLHQSDVDPEDWPEELARLAEQAELRKIPASAVIEAGAYQLLLVERPDVPAEETASAVRWRIRDLLNFSAQEAVVDVFDIPQPRRAPNPMLYAVAARGKAVRRQADAMTSAGLALDAIDIPELCLRNVATALPQDAQGLALLHFERDHGVLTITRGGVLYLIRRIETGRQTVEDAVTAGFAVEGLASDVALELQRSLDYFESHYDQRPIANLMVDPGVPETFVHALGDQVGVSVTQLQLSSLLELDVKLTPKEQARCLLAIGAALREVERALEVAA